MVIEVDLLTLHPEIKWNLDLSDILHGYFSGGVILQIRLKRAMGLLSLILMIVKLMWKYLNWDDSDW